MFMPGTKTFEDALVRHEIELNEGVRGAALLSGLANSN